MSLEIDIKKSFGDFQLDVSFSAGHETLGFLGASGCGKSLTLRCIAGIETPDEGRIVVNGRTFFDSNEGINLKPRFRKTALLFQNYMLFPNLTVVKNIAAGIGKEVPKSERNAIVEKELDRFGLRGFEKRFPEQLSGGQQQRVALARMLAANPEILMLDEPFSALDSHLKGMLEHNLAHLFDGFSGTVLYVSHDIDEALRFCNRIAVVDRGSIAELSDGESLVHHPQTLASMKLSGCKNVLDVCYVDDHRLRLVHEGIELETDDIVPRDVRFVGIRASYIERAESLGPNVFRMKVEQTSDARFERMALLSFIDGDVYKQRSNETAHSFDDDAMLLKHCIYWRVDTTYASPEELPVKGEEILVRFPKNRLYLTLF